MPEAFWICCVALACIGFGLTKAARPEFFLDLWRRHPRLAQLSFYSFILKTKYAKQAVKANGYLLVMIGGAMLAAAILRA